MAEEMNNQTTGTGGTEGATQENNQAQGQQQEGNNTQSTAGEGAKTFTQAEVDAMIKDRLARERKKYQTQQQATTDPTTATEGGTETGATQVEVDVTEDARKQANAIIAQANQRLIQAIAQSEATKLNINPDYVADVVRLADLSKVTVSEDGTVDAKSITTAIEAVLERMPVLKATTETAQGGFRVGGQGTGNKATDPWASNATKNSSETKRWNKNRY